MSLTLDQVKAKSTKRLIGLHPVVLAATQALIERCYDRCINIVITQGLRTIAEQDALYAQGRTKPGTIVTNAKGGTSYHNYGLAINFALLLPDGKQVSWDLKRDGDGDKIADWTEVIQEAKAIGFEWGGDFVSIKDAPHFQMTFGLTTSQLRAGVKPSGIAMSKATAIIDRLKGEVDEDMSRIKELEAIVVKQEERLAAVEKRLNISGKETYAINYTEAITAAKAVGAISTSAEKSKLELNVIQMLYNMGLFAKGDK
ncbi:M15 family metallopeptidase [Paenibacillus sp. FSL R10-2734]|uniref:M15 family metallopeptidase n=1 Tax=Paenibacillus sp. FSL R10-2734 TaxID=2954691 RepID=UPI0030D8A266